MTTFLAVVGSVPPGRLNAAIATAVEMAAARPGVSASLLNLADHYRGTFRSAWVPFVVSYGSREPSSSTSSRPGCTTQT